MSFFHSIKFRFTVWYLLVLVVLLGSLSSVVYVYQSRSLYKNLDSSLELRSGQLQSMATILDSIREGHFQEELGEIVVLCFYSGGEMVAASPREMSFSLDGEFIARAVAGETRFVTARLAEGEEVRLIAVPFNPGGSRRMTEPAAVVVGRSTREIEQALAGLLRILTIAVPLTLVVAAGGGLFLSTRALQPVDEIARTARNISESDLRQRIEVNTRDELGRLAITLNQMIERLQKAFERQRQFTGDASHDLRTPVTVIQAEASLALQRDRPASEYRKSLENIAQETSQMSSIIDRLLIMARADAGKEQLALEQVDFSDLLQGVATNVEILCREKGLLLEKGEVQRLAVVGDKAMLRQLLTNLLDNAVRYTPSGGTVSYSLRAEGPYAVVTVADTGIGISPEDLPLIFERFYRVDRSRSRTEGGSGLGLAICRHMAEVHGGRIEVDSRLGQGSTFAVRLPAFQAV